MCVLAFGFKRFNQVGMGERACMCARVRMCIGGLQPQACLARSRNERTECALPSAALPLEGGVTAARQGGNSLTRALPASTAFLSLCSSSLLTLAWLTAPAPPSPGPCSCTARTQSSLWRTSRRTGRPTRHSPPPPLRCSPRWSLARWRPGSPRPAASSTCAPRPPGATDTGVLSRRQARWVRLWVL